MTKPAKNKPAQTSEPSHAWKAFAQKLAIVLTKLNEDEFMCLSVKGSDRYVRFSLEWVFGIRVETTSNAFLGEHEQLDEKQIASLIAGGWSVPTWNPNVPFPDFMIADVPISDDETDPCPNYFVDLNHPVSFDAVASLTVRTFTEILGVAHPELLEYFAFDEDEVPIEFPELGLDFEELVAVGDDQDLSRQLQETIRGITGIPDLENEEDGVIGIRSGSALVFVWVSHEGQFVSFSSQIVTDVQESTAIFSRLNDINANEVMLRVYYGDGLIYAAANIPTLPFVGAHVAEAFGYFCDAADRLGVLLQKEFGGITAFDIQSTMLH
jgi:hypothetical protein